MVNLEIMKVLKNFSLFLFFALLTPIAMAQGFEGVITVKETKRNAVITKKIYVKGDLVRVETYLPNDENDLKGVRLVDLKSGKVTALLPSRKLYLDVPNRDVNRPLAVEINKTDEKATILGRDCKKVIITAKAKQTEVEFWIANDNFTFYAPLMERLNKNENISTFFGKLSDKGTGAMPLKMIEKRLDGTEVMKREVTSITSKTVEDSMFTIPDGYSLQEK